jgi:2-dehydro-3-deoxyphosphogluconate aldolase / (4S)-4-hydroxy-2-oxoglutarate aldolase
MANQMAAEPSPLERYKKTVGIIEAHRLFILLTGESAAKVLNALGEIKDSGHGLVALDYKITGVKDRMKQLKSKGERGPGVYSISTAKEVRTAINAGAEFIFTNHLDKGVTKKCRHEKIFHAAGALTPKEVYEAHELGADAVSIYPSAAVGGVGWLSRLKEMYPDYKLIATDVMTVEEACEYLKAGAYAVAPIIDTHNAEGARDLIQAFIDSN